MNKFIFKMKNQGEWKIILMIVFFSLLLFGNPVHAETVYQDVDVKMGIEIGDDLLDFEDANKIIEKGRFVKYQIRIKNSGSHSHGDLLLLVSKPDYMEYIKGSTVLQSEDFSYSSNIPDIGDDSPLEVGYEIQTLTAGKEIIIELQFQAIVPEEVKDESLYTFVFASLFGQYSAIPVLSQAIEAIISGEAKPTVQVDVEVLPSPESQISPGMQITYNYNLHNVGGAATSDMTITSYLPNNTTCISGCGAFTLDPLDPNEEGLFHEMVVLVDSDLSGVTEIVNIGYDLSGENFEIIEYREPITSATTGGGGDDGQILNEFTLIVNQVPNVILNSADGVTQRLDGADLTETQYSLLYGGRKQQYTYPILSTTDKSRTQRPCGTYSHSNQFGAYFYAYNSNGYENSESVSGIGLFSTPIEFNVNTVLPETSPKLEFTVNTPMYSFGSTSEVNKYMKEGVQIDIPSIFTESRAVQNGAMGIVSSEVIASVSEDLWQYNYAGRDEYLCTKCYSCGEDCTRCVDYDRPVYVWQKSSLPNVELKDDDTTHISVYTSTAWLKTQGGHIGTNGNFTNEIGEFNSVDLMSYQDINNEEDSYARSNEYIRSNHLTPSSSYTPPGEFNAEYMVFGNTGVGDMKTSCGQAGESDCEAWYVEGVEFPFLQKGEVYDRENNPRNYNNSESPNDLIDREKFGEVRTNELSTNLVGTVELGDDIVWNNTGTIIIGGDQDDDVVIFSGGQSRIYTTGDVYIKADIKYQTSSSANYNDITSVRIDARNIYVDGEVEDLEVMILAREGFYSGVSKKQLRILGDVIAKNAFWQREPLLQYDVEEINQPSEYIIEDMRKYIVPAPGDTELPDDYTIWRQVNPATGEVLDSY